MSNTDATLRVENITKRFGDFTAVEDLSFDVRAGRVIQLDEIGGIYARRRRDGIGVIGFREETIWRIR